MVLFPVALQERCPAGARLEVERESQRVRPREKQCVKSGSLGSTRWVCKPCPTAGMDKENLNTRRAKLGALHLLLCSMLSMRGLGGAEKGCRHQRSKWKKCSCSKPRDIETFPKPGCLASSSLLVLTP